MLYWYSTFGFKYLTNNYSLVFFVVRNIKFLYSKCLRIHKFWYLCLNITLFLLCYSIWLIKKKYVFSVKLYDFQLKSNKTLFCGSKTLDRNQNNFPSNTRRVRPSIGNSWSSTSRAKLSCSSPAGEEEAAADTTACTTKPHRHRRRRPRCARRNSPGLGRRRYTSRRARSILAKPPASVVGVRRDPTRIWPVSIELPIRCWCFSMSFILPMVLSVSCPIFYVRNLGETLTATARNKEIHIKRKIVNISAWGGMNAMECYYKVVSLLSILTKPFSIGFVVTFSY